MYWYYFSESEFYVSTVEHNNIYSGNKTTHDRSQSGLNSETIYSGPSTLQPCILRPSLDNKTT